MTGQQKRAYEQQNRLVADMSAVKSFETEEKDEHL